MSSDYEKWKKRRDAKRAEKQRSNRPSNAKRPDSPREKNVASPRPVEFRNQGRTSDPDPGQDDYEQWKRRRDAERQQGQAAYIGSPSEYDKDNAFSEQSDRSSSGCLSARGCGGCLLLFVGLFFVSVLLLSVTNFVYWRQLQQAGPINVLVLGVDERSTESGPFRSDTMILTNFNAQEQEVALLSIPRDLWVTIPTIGENRINTAHFFGGPELAQQVLLENFRLPARPHYVKLNFNGFVDIIDAMGGITINVSERLIDENYPTEDYGVTTVEIPAGEQLMSGETALIYARSRYSTSDFDRSRRQQEIINAIQKKMIQPTIVFRLPAMWNAVQEAISTDLPTRRWFALGMIMVRSEINRASIGPNDTQNFTTSQGAQVLLPIWENIDPTLDRYFR